jgi:hypothetical protein
MNLHVTESQCLVPGWRRGAGRRAKQLQLQTAALHSAACPASPRNMEREEPTCWAGIRKVSSVSRIPGRPAGKENLRGGRPGRAFGRGGARVARPVLRPTGAGAPEASQQATPVTTKSPNMLSSRRVPDLHGRILAILPSSIVFGAFLTK